MNTKYAAKITAGSSESFLDLTKPVENIQKCEVTKTKLNKVDNQF